ncbi:MAG: formate C-acetyltransferase/glycerol dehydratase family glycyl radical enzyme [Firmicutes bacterium HGW-Firmicutes-7]|nr:MAG: formate C-acetyltransferase/glycerol dehydratase family glycyl radical enzyme [Firmicutes bacterium HGW-Firmicutes-7]
MIATNNDLVYSNRIKKLRDKVLDTKPSVCTERARFYTEIYRKNEAMPVPIKRALALEETLKNMSIYIDEGELIVGNHSSKLNAAPFFPEYAVEWMLKELDEFDKRPGDAFYLTEKTKEEIRQICPFWEGRTTLDKGYALMPNEYKEVHRAGIIRAEGNLTSGDAHIAVNYEKILALGLNGYLDSVSHHRNTLDLTDYNDLKKEQFYKSLIIALKALQQFIKRFEHLSLERSKSESDPKRKLELLKISENCSYISENPPNDFYQGLQLVYFVQLVLQIESNGHSVSFGRMDQYLYKFYKRDKAANLITEAFAMELLESTWVKLMSVKKIRSWSHTKFSAGGPLYQNVTIGGQTTTREDAVNDLSLLILKSVGNTKLTQPNLSVRFHQNLSQDFMLECMKVIEKGFGMPAFNNDEIVIPQLINLGVEEDDAYNYSAIGCIEIAVPGKWGYRCTGMSFLNFMRVFMASINDGIDNISGKVFHKGKGTLNDFKSFEELLDAWKDQIAYYAKVTIAIDTAIDTVLEENVPDILCSTFVDNCIPRGKFIKEGGSKYDFISGLQVGIANLGNSLVAIKKLVFEEKRISSSELTDALDNDFEGIQGEKIRQILLNYAPKFGNDDDDVDLLLKDAYMDFINELAQYHTTRFGRGPIGCKYYAGTSSISSNVPSGAVVKATPDGRKAYMPLAEGSSPSSGTDILGPTAVFKSISKLPVEKILGGILLNQKLNPQSIKNESDKNKLISMLRTFFTDLKGWHVQYNIVSRETLLDAKKNPEQYRDLIIRVAGYSAFFNTLSPDTQDDIISRTEHSI